MIFFDTLEAHFNQLDRKTWYKYLAGAGAALVLLIGIILYFYYRSVNKWDQTLEGINESRQEVQQILTKAKRVERQKAEVNALMAEDPNFKIKGYLQELLGQLGLTGNITSENDTKIDRENNYQENIVTYQLSAITMRQLTEFLNHIDENKRVFTKELEISKSKKVPHTIDVSVTIATMMPKETA